MDEQYNKEITNQLEPNLPQENFYQEKEIQYKSESRCSKIAPWIFQTLVWIFFIGSILLIIFGGTVFIGTLCFYIVFYITYMCIEFNSSTAKFLRNKNSDEDIKQKILKYISTSPKITLYCESYHNESHTYTTTDMDGNSTTHFETVKVVTHSETLDFPYYSVRDISGTFYLNCDEASARKKRYIKLELEEEINFADAISYNDYFIEKNAMCDRNRHLDNQFGYSEKRIIPGLIHHNLIKLGDSDNCTVNYCFFVLSTILTFAEFYKIYFNSLCVQQKYKIRKIVSTRYDLNQPEFEKKYQDLTPRIDLISQAFDFQSKDYNYLNNEFQVNIPTKEELEKAQQFQDKIPEYKISNNGVIVEAKIPNNDDENYNEENHDNNEINNGIDIPLIQIGQKEDKTPNN